MLRNRCPNYDYVTETLNIWKSYHGKDMLEAFYKDKYRNAFQFQSLVIQTMSNRLEKCNSPIIIMERSLNSTMLFMKKLCRENALNETEYYILLDWIKMGFKLDKRNIPDATIYLKSSVTTCIRRIEDRARKQERNVGRSYLADIEKLHRERYDTKSEQVLVVDANKNKQEMLEECENIIDWLEVQRSILTLDRIEKVESKEICCYYL